tara:strand:+ start:1960 stop:3489 length:1530 start_codon:yes stop_codon:yes gene_type:complete
MTFSQQPRVYARHNLVSDPDRFYTQFIPSNGHTQLAAIADLWDNSIDAGAKDIGVQLKSTLSTGDIEEYLFWDDGEGMDEDTLVNSFIFCGEDTNRTRSTQSLGKYGIGGTSAAITLARERTTLTSTREGKLLYGSQDMSRSGKQATQLLTRTPTADERTIYEEFCPDGHGTVIILTRLRKSIADSVKRTGPLKDRILKNLGQMFRHYMFDKDIDFSVVVSRPPSSKSYSLEPKDPLYRHKPAKVLNQYMEYIDHDTGKITLRFVELDLSVFPDDKKKYSEQGLYWVRNGREIAIGSFQTGIWQTHGSVNSGRVEISWDASLDEEMGLQSTKNKVAPSQSIVDKIDELVKPFRRALASRNKNRPAIPPKKNTLAKQQSAFTKRLQAAAPSIGYTKITGPIIPKSKKSVGVTGASYKIPQFSLESHPHNNKHVWADFNASGVMKIVINENHDFIIENYIEGSPETQKALRTEWAAFHKETGEYYGSRDFSVVKSYLEKQAQTLTQIWRFV